MLKKVVKVSEGVAESRRGNRVTLQLEWICDLECGHTEARIRSTKPDKLKCSTCS